MGPVSHLAGRYLLQERVGGSGRSEAWRAWDEVLTRTVAVRLVSAKGTGPGFRVRFQDEVRAAAGVLHPHLVVIYDYGEAPGPNRIPTPYVIMEYFDGESLADLIERGVPALPDTLRIFGQLAAALAAAHDAGIVHCDLKPANVLLTDSGVKVLGLGIARVLRDEDCAAPRVGWFGEPEDHGPAEMPVYLAPEDLGEEPMAAPADMYAFGVMLAEALTGSRTFDSGPLPHLPAEIAELCARCRATDPEARPSAAAAAQILTAADPSSRPGAPGMPGMPGVPRPPGLRPYGTGGQARPADDRPTGPMPTVERAHDGAFSGPIPRPRVESPAAAAPATTPAAAAAAAVAEAYATGERTGPAAPPAAARQRGRRRPGVLVLVTAASLAITAVITADRFPDLFDLLGGGRSAEDAPALAGPATGAGVAGPGGAPPGGTDARTPPVSSHTLAALARMRPLVEQGSAAGEIRSDVAVDLNNVITNLQNDLVAGRQVDLEQRVTEVAVKIATRFREGALTRGRAVELSAALVTALPRPRR